MNEHKHKILVFDNYDSFTYNLVHLVEKITQTEPDVYRNDEISLDKIKAYDKIILSPGPGIPEEAGLLLPLIKEYAATKSILGVCLGMQAIGQAFGGNLLNLSTVYHGVATPVKILNRELTEPENSSTTNHKVQSKLFDGLPGVFEAGRYHSWIVSDKDFPEELEITAVDEQGYIMALRHRVYDVQGVQFHPESVLTPDGEKIIRNWLSSGL